MIVDPAIAQENVVGAAQTIVFQKAVQELRMELRLGLVMPSFGQRMIHFPGG